MKRSTITFEDLKWEKACPDGHHYFHYDMLCYHAKVVFPNNRMVFIEWAPGAKKIKFTTEVGYFDGTELINWGDDIFGANYEDSASLMKRLNIILQTNPPRVKVCRKVSFPLPYNLVLWRGV